MKSCGICKAVKPLESFALNYQQKSGRSVYCKECLAAKSREAYKANPKKEQSRKKQARKDDPRKQKGYQLKSKFGITIDEYEQLFKKQKNRCAICKSKKHNGKGWHVDHDHATGKVRGILCLNCNTGIGMLRDDVAILQAAVLYLSD